MSRVALPFIREEKHGRIVNIGSVVGFVPAPYPGLYAASNHALEGYSESLDHEVREFGIRVSVIERGFTKTKMAQNHQVVSNPLDAYGPMRGRAIEAMGKTLPMARTLAGVATVVLQAHTSRAPRMGYLVGSDVRFVGRLRKFAPAALFDRGLRKQFGLVAA